MASYLRNAIRMRTLTSRLNFAFSNVSGRRLIQPVCSIYTSNKQRDAVSAADEKLTLPKIETVDNIADKEEVRMMHACVLIRYQEGPQIVGHSQRLAANAFSSPV